MKLLFTICFSFCLFLLNAQNYTQHIVTSDCVNGGPSSPVIADINGDGLLDIVYNCSNDNIKWLQNEGEGVFGTNGFGNFHEINPDWQDLKDLRVEDMDGDGDMDVVASFDFFDRIVWYPNDGEGQFGTQQFFEEVVITSETEPWDIHPADLDGDGDTDILAVDFYEDDITWYSNNGGGYFFQAGQQFISDQLNAPSSIQTGDIDGDSDLDIVVSYYLGDRISWFRNNGSENFSSPITISTEVDGPNYIDLKDINNDGSIDVFSKSLLDEKTAWYANDGSGNFEPQVVLSTSGNLWDLDGDGDPDLLSDETNASQIFWIENNGMGMFEIEHLVSEDSGGAEFFYAADMDNDGDIDLVTSNSSVNHITWYENEGIPEIPSGPGDFNNDGYVNTADLAFLLSAFGSECQEDLLCGDLSDDGFVTVDDMAIFLGLFGSSYL